MPRTRMQAEVRAADDALQRALADLEDATLRDVKGVDKARPQG